MPTTMFHTTICDVTKNELWSRIGGVFMSNGFFLEQFGGGRCKITASATSFETVFKYFFLKIKIAFKHHWRGYLKTGGSGLQVPTSVKCFASVHYLSQIFVQVNGTATRCCWHLYIIQKAPAEMGGSPERRATKLPYCSCFVRQVLSLFRRRQYTGTAFGHPSPLVWPWSPHFGTGYFIS